MRNEIKETDSFFNFVSHFYVALIAPSFFLLERKGVQCTPYRSAYSIFEEDRGNNKQDLRTCKWMPLPGSSTSSMPDLPSQFVPVSAAVNRTSAWRSDIWSDFEQSRFAHGCRLPRLQKPSMSHAKVRWHLPLPRHLLHWTNFRHCFKVFSFGFLGKMFRRTLTRKYFCSANQKGLHRPP